jgi:manganese transport protein
MNRSVAVAGKKGMGRWFAFAGPAFLVSVGYMDPGNWATDLLGGSRYGYALLWVVGLSSLMAVFLQTLCARLGIATGRDLAQASREYCPPRAATALWILAEIAIIACDVAEVIGSAVALKLLFGLDLRLGVALTGFDVLLLLALTRFGFRKIEAIVLALVATIFVSFLINLVWAKPDLGAMAHGLFTPTLPDREALLISVGILGATVMPHNLYLHSSIVQTRATEPTPEGRREAVRWATLDTVVALGGAFFVNAAILILAAAVFHSAGQVVEEIRDAYRLLGPVGTGTSATLFAVALLASGQSSTLTGTLAGQIVMEGFTEMRVKPWIRRLVTRLIALIPAMMVVMAYGDKTNQPLVLSQVILSMQLPFAVIPLLWFTSDRRRMGEFVSPMWARVVGGLIASVILVADVFVLVTQYDWRAVGIGAVTLFAYFGWAFVSRAKPQAFNA